MPQSSMSSELRKKIIQFAESDQKNGIKQHFTSDMQRANRFSFDINGLFIDFSKTHITDDLLDAYLQFAKDCKLTDKRLALFAGEKINNTENRAVLHPLLRDTENQGISEISPQLLQQASDAKQQLVSQYRAIDTLLAQRSTPVTDIIHVGIGGSSLGTQLLFEAIAAQQSDTKIHFIGNIDAHKLVRVFAQCNPSSTIVIGVSKTFSTAETLQNITTIISWYEKNNIDDYWQYFYAVTANQDNARSFGIIKENVVTFPQWVGGRYSVWSSVSLSAVLVMGIDKFEEFLAGAALLDRHFFQTELKHNVCFIASMLDHYYANFMRAGSRAVFAYDSRLESLVSYLQQLETESNGKDRQSNGEPVDQQTAIAVWGGVGTDVQHSVFQMLHQGTSLIPSEFIVVKTPDHNFKQHHSELLANAIAQTAALLSGQSLEEVNEINESCDLSEATLKAKVFSGERPSNTIVLDRLTPHALGMLLAFYEHRTFCTGILSNINSYDQMGVELGKRLANQVLPLIDSSETHKTIENTALSFDQSTQQLIKLLR